MSPEVTEIEMVVERDSPPVPRRVYVPTPHPRSIIRFDLIPVGGSVRLARAEATVRNKLCQYRKESAAHRAQRFVIRPITSGQTRIWRVK